MASNKPNLNTSGKNLVCVNDTYIVSKDTLKSVLNRAYEEGWSDSECVGFEKAWSFLLSSALTLFVTTLTFALTLDWSMLSTWITTFVFIMLFLGCAITGFVSLWISRRGTKKMTDQRNSVTSAQMETLVIKDNESK